MVIQTVDKTRKCSALDIVRGLNGKTEGVPKIAEGAVYAGQKSSTDMHNFIFRRS